MATLCIRIRDDLKRKAQHFAQRQGVSLNNFINAAVAASVAQEETLAFFDNRLQDVDLAALRQGVLSFMTEPPVRVPPSRSCNGRWEIGCKAESRG